MERIPCCKVATRSKKGLGYKLSGIRCLALDRNIVKLQAVVRLIFQNTRNTFVKCCKGLFCKVLYILYRTAACSSQGTMPQDGRDDTLSPPQRTSIDDPGAHDLGMLLIASSFEASRLAANYRLCQSLNLLEPMITSPTPYLH